jgi:VIT1/CCC1 family predicted Fe2+/Mn2+ transporter
VECRDGAVQRFGIFDYLLDAIACRKCSEQTEQLVDLRQGRRRALRHHNNDMYLGTAVSSTPPQQALLFIQDELDTAALYDTLASREADGRLSEVYRRLAATERRHADHWIGKLHEQDVAVPRHKVGWRTTVLMWLVRRFGPAAVVSLIATQEQADARRYATVDDRAVGMDRDEIGHARALRAIAGDRGAEGPFIARLEGRHRTTAGNALRAAVLGANDGLVSNLSLIMGVAGANLASREILITGSAGLLACACSMALGEWLSVQSSRELYEKQIDVEAQEIRGNPAEEAEELALIYQAKGLSEQHARDVATRLMASESSALDTLAREELGIDPTELGGSAWQAAFTSFVLCAVGAVIPLVPFLLLSGRAAVIGSLVFSGAGLFAIGAAITVLTGRTVWLSGGRQIAIGLGAAAITFLIGRLIGVALT